MKAPWRYRPEDQPHYQPDSTIWIDKPISNAIAWISIIAGLDRSQVLHKIANPFWTDCPTCLFFRGAVTGAAFAATIAAII